MRRDLALGGVRCHPIGLLQLWVVNSKSRELARVHETETDSHPFYTLSLLNTELRGLHALLPGPSVVVGKLNQSVTCGLCGRPYVRPYTLQPLQREHRLLVA